MLSGPQRSPKGNCPGLHGERSGNAAPPKAGRRRVTQKDTAHGAVLQSKA